MDLLFSKYASPFLLLDGFILTGRLFDFVLEFIDIENEKTMWEFYLHKVHDMSFDEFKKSCSSRQTEPQTDEELETTIQNSQSMLNGFIPQS
jgi:hypothetical protein